MRKLLFIFLIIACTKVELPAQATHYIDPGGSNSNDGSAAHPWLTLAYACANSQADDIIHVNAGIYVLTAPVSVPAVVSIEGDGYDHSIIKSHYASGTEYDGVIKLLSGSQTNGDQHISGIMLDGDALTGYWGIVVYYRHNVSIYNCWIKDFYINGITFTHGNATGCSVYNTHIINSGGHYIGNHYYNLNLNNMTGAVVHDCVIDQTARVVGSNGGCIGMDYNYGTEIYNCTISAQIQMAGAWTFAFELWFTQGLEIHDCTIQGEVDIARDCISGSYDYAVWFHDNDIGWSSMQDGITVVGVQTERQTDGVIIDHNVFHNLSYPIWVCQYDDGSGTTSWISNLQIFDNLIYGVGRLSTSSSYGIYFQTSKPAGLMLGTDDVLIYNNTIIASTTNPGTYGIVLPTGSTMSNVRIKNNIISGFLGSAVYGAHGRTGDVMNDLQINYNDFYNNDNDGITLSGITPTNYTNSPNYTFNPQFVSSSDWHLKSISPAIGAGTNVSLVSDLDYVDWLNPPSIGAYEYTGISVYVPSATTGTFSVGLTTASGTSSATGSAITARGVCYSSSNQAPTLSDSYTSDGSGTGSFTSSLTGLTQNTTYYIRAYATNSAGTGYGSRVIVRTLSPTQRRVKDGVHFGKDGSHFVKY